MLVWGKTLAFSKKARVGGSGTGSFLKVFHRRSKKKRCFLQGEASLLTVGVFLLTVELFGRLIFIYLQCWEVLPFLTIQRQRCIKLRVVGEQDFYTPLALNSQKGQHLPAPEVYKNQSPTL